jgi:uncharacterized repeat protein (TIGR03803 family)
MGKAAIPLCGLLALAVSSCGGGGDGSGSGGGSTTQPLTVTAQILYSFGGTSTDAMGPSGVLIQGSDGNFYGTTYRGGLAQCDPGAATSDPFLIGCGTVFKISPTGEETVLHLFAAAPADGTDPNLLIQGSDGNFYGTTDGGGGNNAGTVFKLTPQGVETVLYSFAGPPDGAAPIGQLIQGSDGNFYGVTYDGGVGTGHPMGSYGGTVFKVTPEGIETILHRFSGPDGQSPDAGLIEGSDGNFYWTTSSGIGAVGTVFKLTPEGVETTLYAFSGSAGSYPLASLIQGSDGNFYGTTSNGGTNVSGTAFQLTPAGVLTVLYSFPKSSVPGPDTNLVQGSDGNLYGASYSGGAYSRGYFFGLALK